MVRRQHVPSMVAAAIVAFGAWVELASRSGWRWSDLLAGALATFAGAVLYSVGRVRAGMVMFAAALSWFLGTWALRLHPDRDV